MIKNNSFLAIIPARGRSKRLPGKNLLDLGGKPLIVHTIDAALNSRYINKIIVSTDSDEIYFVADKYKVKTIKRPENLASDNALTIDVVSHALNDLNDYYDYVVLLQPTSPLRNSNHIDQSIELLKEKGADAIVSVCQMDHSPLWSNTLPDDGCMSGFIRDDVINIRSQDLEKYYRLNGAIYICKTSRIMEENSFFLKDKIYAYIMDRESSIDIDDEIDFKMAEIFFLKMNNKK